MTVCVNVQCCGVDGSVDIGLDVSVLPYISECCPIRIDPWYVLTGAIWKKALYTVSNVYMMLGLVHWAVLTLLGRARSNTISPHPEVRAETEEHQGLTERSPRLLPLVMNVDVPPRGSYSDQSFSGLK